MAKRTEVSAVVNAVSISGVTGATLPQINPEHAKHLTDNLPDDFMDEVGHQEYTLVKIKLDSKTFETVAVYELAVPDEYDEEITLYTCECRIRENRIVRTDRKPITMESDRYHALRG